jgi:membrane protease YdiL (CAAX protease family)
MAHLDQLAATASQKISIRTQLIAFFLLSFLIGWVAWLPLVINPQLPQPMSIIGLFAPALSAVLVAWWGQGKAGVATIFQRYRIWRFSIAWYIFALLVIPVIYGIGLLLATLGTHVAIGKLFLVNSPFFLLAAYIYLMIINSGEEIGWRGFALPLLETQFRRPLFAGLLLGVFWALWHLPLYIYPALATMPYPVFFLFAVGLSVIYMHLFHQTKGSLWPVVMLHAATDVLPRLVQLTPLGLSFWISATVLVWVVAVLMTLLLKFELPKEN